MRKRIHDFARMILREEKGRKKKSKRVGRVRKLVREAGRN